VAPSVHHRRKQTKVRPGKTYKTSKISETAQIQRKLGYTINGLYKVVYEISVAG